LDDRGLAGQLVRRRGYQHRVRPLRCRLRVRRIEQITGRGLTRTEHIAELWISVQSYDLLIGHADGATA